MINDTRVGDEAENLKVFRGEKSSKYKKVALVFKNRMHWIKFNSFHDNVNSLIDKENVPGIINFDLNNVFDMVSHEILIAKV